MHCCWKTSGLVLGLALILGVGESPAFDGPWWGAWSPNGFGCGYASTLYVTGRIPAPPYYAVHPPVYYGPRVRQAYGDSPYAQPPSRWASGGTSSPGAVIIINPYVAGAEAKSSGAQGPQMIDNPYYNANESIPTPKSVPIPSTGNETQVKQQPASPSDL